MRLIRKNVKLTCIFLSLLMFLITVPFDSVLAAMIGTEATLDSTRAQHARDDIISLLLREDVQNALMAQGVNPQEAKARIDSLSDAEVIQIANEIKKLPAGGYLPVWIGILILAGVVLILTTSLATMKYYEPEYPSVDNVDEKSVALYNPKEPWSGNWIVESTNTNISGKWGMKQADNRVISTKYSAREFRGKVEGNQLKGWWGPAGSGTTLELEISSDGQSFKGRIGRTNILVEGKRIQKNHSTEQSDKSAVPFNPEEPWTGIWKVEGSRSSGGTWGMKQKGQTVKSNSDSNFEIEGKVIGDQLKGKVVGDYGISNKFVLNISSDGQSFEGTLTSGFQGNVVRIKGTRLPN
jgi:hypothetical protein